MEPRRNWEIDDLEWLKVLRVRKDVARKREAGIGSGRAGPDGAVARGGVPIANGPKMEREVQRLIAAYQAGVIKVG